jgi:O-antigen/teichoic acid export membrane protein
LPEWTINSFFGARYVEAAPLLKYFGLAMLPMAFLLVLMNYLVAKEKTFFAYIMAASAVLEIGAIYLYHGTPLDIVKAMAAAGSFALVAGIAAQWTPAFLRRFGRV